MSEMGRGVVIRVELVINFFGFDDQLYCASRGKHMNPFKVLIDL